MLEWKIQGKKLDEEEKVLLSDIGRLRKGGKWRKAVSGR